jgi:hypothetical protein
VRQPAWRSCANGRTWSGHYPCPSAAVGANGSRRTGQDTVDIPSGPVRSERSHRILPIFFPASYLLLALPLGPSRTMGTMQRNAFHASRTDRARRRAGGPTLSLIQGTAGTPCATSRVVPHPHPGIEDFTPDGVPASPARPTVLHSEPDGSPSCRTSRGNATPDTEAATQSGSGPTIDQPAFARALAAYLESTAGEPGDRRRPDARVEWIS